MQLQMQNIFKFVEIEMSQVKVYHIDVLANQLLADSLCSWCQGEVYSTYTVCKSQIRENQECFVL